MSLISFSKPYYHIPSSDTLVLHLGNDTTICTGDDLLLDAGSGFDSYLWQDGSTNQTFLVTESGIYWVIASLGANLYSDTISVSNWPYPNPNLGPDLNLCYGESALLEPAFGFASYIWQDNSTLPFYSVTQSGAYWCDVTDYHGCMGTDTVYVYVANIVNLGEDSLNLCTGQSITLNAGSGFDFYSWSTGEYDVSSIEVSSEGLYSVSVSYFFGCPSADSIYIEEVPMPWVSLGSDISISLSDNITLYAPLGPFLYTWQDGSNLSYYVVMGNSFGIGNHIFWVKVFNYCGFDIDSINVNITENSVTYVPNDFYYNVYPNPSHGSFTIEFSNPQNESYSCSIIDGFGKLIFSEKFRVDFTKNKKEVYISNLSQGVYNMIVSSDKTLINTKLLIQ
jgi:hypothetical protein